MSFKMFSDVRFHQFKNFTSNDRLSNINLQTQLLITKI